MYILKYKLVEYSIYPYWKVSDDEDDQHPNIDKASLNKWRHEARIERQKESEKEKSDFEKKKEKY